MRSQSWSGSFCNRLFLKSICVRFDLCSKCAGKRTLRFWSLKLSLLPTSTLNSLSFLSLWVLLKANMSELRRPFLCIVPAAVFEFELSIEFLCWKIGLLPCWAMFFCIEYASNLAFFYGNFCSWSSSCVSNLVWDTRELSVRTEILAWSAFSSILKLLIFI